MQGNQSGVPLAKALSLPGGTGANKAYLDIMLEEDLPVLRVNRRSHTRHLTPFKPIYEREPSFWQKSGDDEFFLTGYSLDRLRELATARTGSWNIAAEEFDAEEGAGFGSEYDAIAQMPIEQKAAHLSRESIRLNELLIQKSKDRIAVAEALAGSAKDAAMINHAVLEEIINFADEQARAYSRDVVIQTNEMVKTSAQLLSRNILSDELMRTITDKSKGIVFRHITRVYLNGVAFLAYINNRISSSSAVIKIRTSFNLKYRKFYQALLPHIHGDLLTLDNVFLEGLAVIPPDMLYKWSVGFLIHDLGKAADIEYHEGEAGYDRGKVVDHVKVGYGSILRKTNYPREAGLMAGYHHEYYGDSDGYGPFRSDLQEHRSRVPGKKQDCCVTCEMEDILAFNALAYFPAKALEILDVYDSLTDTRRARRASLSSEEALGLMYKEFIVQRRKIDPILFDLFCGFVRERERIKN